VSALHSIQRVFREFEAAYGPGSARKDGLVSLFAMAAVFVALVGFAAITGSGS